MPVMHNSPEWQHTVEAIATLHAETRILAEAVQQLGSGQTAIIEKLTLLVANTAPLPTMLGRIDNLESSRDRFKGAMWAFGVGGTILGALSEWLLRKLGGS